MRRMSKGLIISLKKDLGILPNRLEQLEDEKKVIIKK